MHRRSFAPAALAALLVACAPRAANAVLLVVNNTNDSGAGSLTQAITDANATAEADQIVFTIPGGGVKVIDADLPPITQPLTIDAFNQTGSSTNTNATGPLNTVLAVRLEGPSVPINDAILDVQAGPFTLRGVSLGNIKAKTAGVEIAENVTEASIRGCFIGTDVTGGADTSSGIGILVRGTASIGGTFVESRNLISGNSVGIQIRGPGSVVRGNLIGTNVAGEPTVGNGIGIQMLSPGAAGNVIGPLGNTATNVIAGNEDEGILLSADAGSGNTLRNNLFFDNGGLAIDLGGDGPTANDETDDDDGPNGLVNAPEISVARVNGTRLRVNALLRGKPGTYGLTFHYSSDPHPSGFGEGESFVPGGLNALLQNAPLAVTVDVDLPEAPVEGFWITATATSVADNSTSEFSRAVEAVQAGVEAEVTNTSDSGPGSLRAALDEANSDPDRTTIVFDIPGNGPHTIALQSSLFVSQGPAMIDGFSQQGSRPNQLLRGSNLVPGVVLDGSAIAGSGPVIGVSQTAAILRGIAVVKGPADGILLDRVSGSTVEGCMAGTGPTIEAGAGNAGFGIRERESSDARIGGPNVGQRNVLAGNDLGGIVAGDGFLAAYNNLIGTVAVPNGTFGILLGGEGAQIGGDDPAFHNEIVGNTNDGVRVNPESKGNEVHGNRIRGNGGLGIDLAVSGQQSLVTPNDANDADAGANDRQNFPVLGSVVAEPGLLTIEGTIDLPPERVNNSHTLRLFRNDSCDPSGHGEGEEFLGAIEVFVGEAETIGALLPVVVPPGSFVSATITDPAFHNTSEFSACVPVEGSGFDCGDENGDGSVVATDALNVLKTAVNLADCAKCVCDVDDSGSVVASDALLVLRVAVGQAVALDCPASCS